MFYFLHSDQKPENTSYYRGMLFEDLLRQFLRSAGYVMQFSRRKINSLEYDLSGVHEVNQHPVLGEAKAHEDTIGGQDVSAFAGKLSPHYYRNSHTEGIFLSTSPLSPDAEDFLRDANATNPYKINRICGYELEQRIRASLRLPASDQIAIALKAVMPSVIYEHLLHTNAGTFVIAVGSSRGQAFPNCLAVIDRLGNLITEKSFYDRVRSTVPALQELEPVQPPGELAHLFESRPRDIPRGLVTASDWLDYRRPADPHFFVGRVEAISEAERIGQDSERGTVVEIKSRSGVGKSSVLAVLAARLGHAGHTVELHDSRDVHSAGDVLTLISRLVGEKVSRFEDVPKALADFSTRISSQGKRGFFIADQFESTFHNKEVFSAYEYVALAIARADVDVSMIYARKDDLLTTHDDSAVNLERLRQISHPIALEDFTSSEATELLKNIASASNIRFNTNLLAPVLEFAKGFPWLLKRTMAHVLSVLKEGTSQKELLSGGLQLQDLFEEELSGLDEIEQGYLRRLASNLPATYQNLLRRYEGDPFLPKVLEKLTERRLLRLSAGTYDTYSDVFKEFLLYERLPESTHSYIFKMGPVPVMGTFRSLGGSNQIDIEELSKKIGKTIGGTYNVLRDMRLVGLVDRTPNGWIVPAVVRGYEHQGRLGEYVRQSVLKNQSVTNFLGRIELQGSMNLSDVAEFLKNEFPFVEASDNVWDSYSATFMIWLKALKFVSFVDASRVVPEARDRSEIIKELGNLEIRGRGLRRVDAPFMPCRELIVYERALSTLKEHPAELMELRKSDRDAAQDLLKIGAAQRTHLGKLRACWSIEELRRWAERLVWQEEYGEFWRLLNAGASYETASTAIQGFDRLSPSTQVMLASKMANWGRQFGMIPNRRITKNDIAERGNPIQPSLFDTLYR